MPYEQLQYQRYHIFKHIVHNIWREGAHRAKIVQFSKWTFSVNTVKCLHPALSFFLYTSTLLQSWTVVAAAAVARASQISTDWYLTALTLSMRHYHRVSLNGFTVKFLTRCRKIVHHTVDAEKTNTCITLKNETA